MTRSLIPGGTDYSHQTLRDLLGDLEGILALLHESQGKLKNWRERLQVNGYWPIAFVEFRSLFNHSIQFYDTCIEEVTEILSEIQTEVQPHHANQLAHLSKTANELNRTFGLTWHQYFEEHEYGDPTFQVLEYMYSEGRQMAVDLLDLSNMATRLRTFVGKRSHISPGAIINANNRTQLRENLKALFNLDEFNLPDDNRGGDTLESKARELIEYCIRRNMLDDLAARCRELRPDGAWFISKTIE